MTRFHHLTGELIGTFILVFFGCGSVAVTVLFSAHVGLLQVAVIWGLAVALAIYATRHLSCAHLNPAVSLAMVLGGRMSARKLPAYLSGQFIGAFLGAAVLYLLFGDSIARFESLNGIVRGTSESIASGMMFGEYYPNPGAGTMALVSHGTAMLAEGIGTFLLVFMVFSLTEGCNVGRPDNNLAPLFIGLTVSILISILAPLTQAGLNPTRDLAPRLFAWMSGWGPAAFPDAGFGFLTVYVLAPIIGGSLAALFFSLIIEPQLHARSITGDDCLCQIQGKNSKAALEANLRRTREVNYLQTGERIICMSRIKITVLSILLLLTSGGITELSAAPKPDLWPRWQEHVPASTDKVDHAAWDHFLKQNLITGHPSGIHLVNYAAVTPKDRRTLAGYLDQLQRIQISSFNRTEQMAFWINLYNALTIKVVLDHYPVESIRDIDISPGWFSIGPWDAKLLTIEGEKISLNDIEHRILRPIWEDPRVHYAVNCASLGCPNLQPEPFTAANTEKLLEKGAREYVNHRRGVGIEDDWLVLSSIYDWFQIDFGDSEKGVIKHLKRFASPPLQEKLQDLGISGYRYDWSLNEP